MSSDHHHPASHAVAATPTLSLLRLSAAERLIVGKWITDNLFLSYAHSFAADPNENSGEASLEYRFRKRWLIEGYYGDRGNGGLDLLWTKRF